MDHASATRASTPPSMSSPFLLPPPYHAWSLISPADRTNSQRASANSDSHGTVSGTRPPSPRSRELYDTFGRSMSVAPWSMLNVRWFQPKRNFKLGDVGEPPKL